MGSINDAVTIGYFTVVEEDRTGWTGGLLVLNSGGRPLEFQCTLPIRPTKTHEILFGNSLRQHLISDVIGNALLAKCRTPIDLLCCEQVEAIRLQADAPERTTVALVTTAAEADEGPIEDSMLDGHCRLLLAETPILVPLERLELAKSLMPKLTDFVDAVEPFERIRDAIREAHSQIARAA